MLISLAFPLVLFFLVAGPEPRIRQLGGIPFAVYYMTGMAAWGGDGGDAVVRRAHRDGALRRVEPPAAHRRRSPPARYFRAKLLTAYALAALSIVLLYTRRGPRWAYARGRASGSR